MICWNFMSVFVVWPGHVVLDPKTMPRFWINFQNREFDLLGEVIAFGAGANPFQLFDLRCRHDTMWPVSGSDILYGSAQS